MGKVIQFPTRTPALASMEEAAAIFDAEIKGDDDATDQQ